MPPIAPSLARRAVTTAAVTAAVTVAGVGRLLPAALLAAATAVAGATGVARVAGAQQPATYVPAAGAPDGFDRAAALETTVRHTSDLIRRNTQNPPGNEIAAAAYLDSALRTVPGVETRILEAAPGRANFHARLRAIRPTRRPLLVMGHLDVVTADTAKWSTDPFDPVVQDGYLYGRGAIDDKGMLAATVAAITQLATQRDRLQRDVILIGTAGEEGGPTVGIAWLMEHHPELVRDVEFALNEGGRIRVQDGRVRTVNVQTTEKVYYDVVARAAGTSGHGSVPLPDNALAALARAVARVHAWEPPVRLNETTRLYFQRLGAIEQDPLVKGAMLAIADPAADSATMAAATRVLQRDPLHSAVLRTGASLTLLDGGIRSNVIPSEGTATFNVRILPDEDIREVVAAMNRVGAEPAVTFTLDGEPEDAPPPSPVGTALFQAMERAALAMAPDATVIPFMSTGATDGAVLRAAGIPTYGILPMPLPMEDELRMHGDDERVPVAALGWAAEYLYRVIAGVAF